MDTDFIKWMCEKAESVSIDNGTTLFLMGNPICICDFQNNNFFKKVLLQEAIEGVNKKFNLPGRKTTTLPIMIDQIGVHIHSHWYQIFMDWGASPNIDESKEAALRYVYEWEKKGNHGL